MTDDAVKAAAPAKINLYLHVTGKRDDGYHILDSLVVFAGIQDVVSATIADTLTFGVDGTFADQVPLGGDNLVLKAAEALRKATGCSLGAHLQLTKRLPVASGIGGGSADAAATLRALCTLWNLSPSPDTLSALALSLGADVPVCLAGKAAFMSGIGEKLAPAPTLPEAWLVLANPGIPIATPDVFKARTADFSKDGRFSYAPGTVSELAGLLGARHNDLEAPARALAPVIDDVLTAMTAEKGCLLSRLSGSGATVFGLFGNAERATQAALTLASAYPDWWVRPASLETNAMRLDQNL